MNGHTEGKGFLVFTGLTEVERGFSLGTHGVSSSPLHINVQLLHVEWMLVRWALEQSSPLETVLTSTDAQSGNH